MAISGTLEHYQPVSIYSQQQWQRRPAMPPQPQRPPAPAKMPKGQALSIAQKLKRGVVICSLLFFGTAGTLVAGHILDTTSVAHNTSIKTTSTTSATKTTPSAIATSTTTSNSSSQGSYSFGSSNSSSSAVSSTSVS